MEGHEDGSMEGLEHWVRGQWRAMSMDSLVK